MTDNPDLDEAIRLLGKRVCAPELWTARDTEATGRLLAKYPERPKLLPCPFCGGNDVIFVTTAMGGRAVRCTDCGVQGGGWANDSSTASAWNRRAKPASGPVDGGKAE